MSTLKRGGCKNKLLTEEHKNALKRLLDENAKMCLKC